MRLIDFLPNLDEYHAVGGFDRKLSLHASKDPELRHGGKPPAPEEMCAAVIFYAEHDAYLPD